MKKKNIYSAQENEYQKMEKNGTENWGEHIGQEALDGAFLDFIKDCEKKEWFPEKGRVLELGCGTAPILRFFYEKGFNGTGVEICETAVKIAKRLSQDTTLDFKVGDVTKDKLDEDESYDIVIDGNCLHCILKEEDRKSFMDNAYRLLKDKGVLLLFTMASPVDESAFLNKIAPSILHDKIICCKTKIAEDFDQSIYIDGEPYLPTRYIDSWENIIQLVKDSGFDIKLFKVDICPDDKMPMTHICLACIPLKKTF